MQQKKRFSLKQNRIIKTVRKHYECEYGTPSNK